MSGGATAATAGVVRLDGVRKTFGETVAVRDVDLEVEAGGFVTLLGPSGCGKTTLLRMIAGFEQPSAGRIHVAGRDVTDLPPERRPLNMVFQRYALFPHLNVAENVAYGLVNKGLAGEALRSKVGAALAMVDMEGFGERSTKELSGGQSQRVALARALVNEPEVLLLDEPLAALDLQLRKRMQIELRSLHRRLGTTFLFVTHDQEEALTMSDRIAVMNDGAVIQFDTPSGVYHHPATRFVASFVGESTLLACEVLGRDGPRLRVRLVCGGAEIATADWGADLAEGTRAWLMLRPERLRVVEAARGRLSGRLEDVFFLGWSYRHLVRLDDGVQAKADAEQVFEAGSDGRVGLDWDEDAAVPVADPS